MDDRIETVELRETPDGPGREVFVRRGPEGPEPDVPEMLRDAVYRRNSLCYWVCEKGSDFYDFACEQGWMAVTRELAQTPELEYDVLSDGIRIVRYKETPWQVRVPDEIDGIPVTSIGNNAFPESVEELHVGANVREILGRTTCPRLRKVSLPAGLRRLGPGSFSASPFEETVVIPASCTEIGRSSLGTGRCRFAAVGAEVLLDQLFTNRCFCAGVPPFDFAQYDRDLTNYLNPKRKLAPVLVRMGTPYGMSEETRLRYVEFLLKHMRDVMAALEKSGDVAVLHQLLEVGRFTDEQLTMMADRLATAGQTACVVEVVEARRKLSRGADSPGARYAL